MSKAPTEAPVLDQRLADWACLPIQGIAALIRIWCWQTQVMGELASLTLAPLQAVHFERGAADPSPFEKAAAQSLFDIAFCLGATGEQHPFPD